MDYKKYKEASAESGDYTEYVQVKRTYDKIKVMMDQKRDRAFQIRFDPKGITPKHLEDKIFISMDRFGKLEIIDIPLEEFWDILEKIVNDRKK